MHGQRRAKCSLCFGRVFTCQCKQPMRLLTKTNERARLNVNQTSVRAFANAQITTNVQANCTHCTHCTHCTLHFAAARQTLWIYKANFSTFILLSLSFSFSTALAAPICPHVRQKAVLKGKSSPAFAILLSVNVARTPLAGKKPRKRAASVSLRLP